MIYGRQVYVNIQQHKSFLPNNGGTHNCSENWNCEWRWSAIVGSSNLHLEENADNVRCQVAAIFCNFQELNMYVSRSVCWDAESILCVFPPNMFCLTYYLKRCRLNLELSLVIAARRISVWPRRSTAHSSWSFWTGRIALLRNGWLHKLYHHVSTI